MANLLSGYGLVLPNDSSHRSNTALDVGSIAASRKRLGLSQRELAESLGVSLHTVQSWEQDRRKPSQLAVKFMRFLFDKK